MTTATLTPASLVPAPIGAARAGRSLVPKAALAVGLGFGAVSSLSVFMGPLEAAFGWSRADLSMGYTLLTLGMAGGGLLWGALADTRHLPRILVGGAAGLGLGLALASRVESVLAYWAIAAGIGLLGFGALYVPLCAVVGARAGAKRGLALGLVTAGGAVGQGVLPVVAERLIALAGWREAFLVLGLAIVALLVPAMATIAPPPERSRPLVPPDGAAAAAPSAAPATIWLSAAAFFCCACMAVPLVHLVSLTCAAGYAPATGAGLVSLVMLTGAASRIGIGALADRVGGLATYLGAGVLQTGSVLFFATSGSLAILAPVGIVFGMGFAGTMTSLLVLVRESVPAAAVGRTTGITGVFAWLGMGAGGALGGIVHDATGGYLAAFALAAVAGAINVAILLGFGLARRRGAL
ncbi:MFS transporter [Salinarimonas sp.]|uniref:MFS transporter n=1 Tax=Salinarimonas sp. TaxID=2766526 RepID=UPI0032D92A5C